jgi:glycosyltransferase involved in cell wall biosynthesis
MPNIEKQTELLNKCYFQKADAVTTISNKVKNDLTKFYNKTIHVIYNPIKDVYLDEKIEKNNTFFYVGRANDPIKRFNLIKESLSKISDGEKNLKVCGAENPKFGNYLGIIKDNKLNEIYNSSKYILLPSRAEGLGLPMIEGMICGAIPITCSDNLTAKEFSPSDFICEPNSRSLINKIEELEKDYITKRKISLEYGNKYKTKFNKKNIAKNIIKIFNLK